jgi:hypothetical protein
MKETRTYRRFPNGKTTEAKVIIEKKTENGTQRPKRAGPYTKIFSEMATL